MHLAGNFEEAERWIEVIADGILGERFDFGVAEAGGAEVIEGVLDEHPAQAPVAMRGGDGQVGNVTDAGFAVLPGGDVADNLVVLFGDKNAGRVAGNIFVNVSCLSPPPIMTIDGTKSFFDAVINRDTEEAVGGKALEVFEICRLE